ncbi:hypothetical protein [Pedobacter sp. MW01-1-1]|uniref:hypothetical protein n=1 Tax=Pedobacter sp. MW01-1-1 TaxID=3383027 RepID=UPI003FF0B782
MNQKIITLCYRKIFDSNSPDGWEKVFFEDSFAELKMQAQLYNTENKWNTFAELRHQNPQADKLHFLVGASLMGYIQQLHGIIPDVVDNLGRRFLRFEHSKFEIINSDLTQIAKHQVAVNFFSTPVLWHDTIDDFLLISHQKLAHESEHFTNLFKIPPFVSIHSLTFVAQ